MIVLNYMKNTLNYIMVILSTIQFIACLAILQPNNGLEKGKLLLMAYMLLVSILSMALWTGRIIESK